MFFYELPDGGLHDYVSINKHGDIKFDPPVWEQRYVATLRILEDPRWSAELKKVVEFGCCEMKMLPLMRRIDTVEHIMQVDIDEQVLTSNQHRGVPLTSDYLKKRERPLRIEIFRGSIADSVDNLRDADAVVALEVIEHLEQDVLDKVPQNIFGFIQPKLVIISTPNREYNVLFNGLNANGFRIDDHKFEWTRKEFQNWAKDITNRYPNYEVAFIGVGSPPPTHKNIGHVTQMAIFARKDLLYRPLKTPISQNLLSDSCPEVQYKEIYAVNYPQHIDDRTTVQKIKDEITGYISMSQSNENYYIPDQQIYKIPIKYLYEYALSIHAKEEDILAALKEEGFDVENDFIVLTEDYVHEHYRTPFDDDLEAEEFLDYIPYREEIGDDENVGTENTSRYEDDNEPEENWD